MDIDPHPDSPSGDECLRRGTTSFAPSLARRALDALPERLAVIDPDGRIRFVNRAWARAGKGGGALSGGRFPRGADYRSLLWATRGVRRPDALALARGMQEIAAGLRDAYEVRVPPAPGDSDGRRIRARPLAPERRDWIVVREEDRAEVVGPSEPVRGRMDTGYLTVLRGR